MTSLERIWYAMQKESYQGWNEFKLIRDDYYCVVGIVVDVVVDIMAELTLGDVEFIGEVLPKFRQAIMDLNLNS